MDLSLYLSFTPSQKEVVWTSLTSADPKVMMPRNPDNTAGKRLTPAELSLFFKN